MGWNATRHQTSGSSRCVHCVATIGVTCFTRLSHGSQTTIHLGEDERDNAGADEDAEVKQHKV
eukprot:4726872-Amphidinium_carterae.1